MKEIPGSEVAVVARQQLLLHPFKGAYWEAERILLIADLHLGKVAHFRKEGIPVPREVSDQNWDRLISMLLDVAPERVLFLGDLFHSHYNTEWEDFCQLLDRFPGISFELVEGNHDILTAEAYQQAGIVVHQEPFNIPPFSFSHHPIAGITNDLYNIAGHIHPCVYLKGWGKQRTRLACFYFGTAQGLLPAFGAFTGMAKVSPKRGEQVFVIAGEEVIPV
jgi:DNA ligase-associated metallophosphoesterase